MAVNPFACLNICYPSDLQQTKITRKNPMKKVLLIISSISFLGTSLPAYANGAKKLSKVLTSEQRIAALEEQVQKMDARLQPFETRHDEAIKYHEARIKWGRIGLGTAIVLLVFCKVVEKCL